MSFDTISESVKYATEKLFKLDCNEGNNSLGAVGLRVKVPEFISYLQVAMYPHIYCKRAIGENLIKDIIFEQLNSAAIMLKRICLDLIEDDAEQRTNEVIREFFASLPEISKALNKDVTAAYEGDPAAKSTDEIMLAYPAFEAIFIYRLAHKLYCLNVPVLPRMMTEHAHKLTGIDIHPGATIGEYFFIDHGTGVVIGETCVIGNRVKLYQGVTLGAKSFEADENGNPVKGIKRHPNIGNNVVIYSGATILGGNTFVGDDCVIGGNVWLTHSVPSGETVYYGAIENQTHE